ncbi:hypothetical protein BOTBODRAFT_180497 [Botryobasidium botryosum FD-172 SS1]|uniref:Uncharacterized protein n=1 Tax=Botryobasidium botryosum (strain FD-172 SS1) TaxID=930990 RepID=A0A067M6W7_BOTB1|nr:hypothetical protein BOTBODRAFT_180497 [Botryobasidium botryosum FD-172 SS1]
MDYARSQGIFVDAEAPRVLSFSSVTSDDLTSMGISKGWLFFLPSGINALLSYSPPANDHYTLLLSQLIEIYDHVNVNYDAGVCQTPTQPLMELRRQSEG